MKLRCWLMGFLLLLVSWAKGQDSLRLLSEPMENLAELTGQETEDDSGLQQLLFLKDHPLNVNTATAEDLQVFYFLTDIQIHQLLQYRKMLNSFVSIYELQSIPGWDETTIRRIRPYVTVQLPVTFVNDFREKFQAGNHYLLLRTSRIVEKAKGYNTLLNNHFAGDRNHVFFRYRYQCYHWLQYGITADKDAGEAFFKGANTQGFDFYSAHLFVQNKGIIQALAVGDFTVNMGQGLIQWQTLAFNKSAEVLAIKRQSPLLKPYTSSGENYFLRGAGITFKKGKIESTVFASMQKIDAHAITDTARQQTYFTSFLTSGLHRTAAEIASKNSVLQKAFGGNVQFQNQVLKIGMNAVRYQFSAPLQKRNEPYNLFALYGKSWSNASLDYNYVYKNIYFFGEAAIDKYAHKAFLNGALISADPKVDISILHRHIEAAYQTVYGNAFTENSTPVNERGVYVGLHIKPVVSWFIDAYADFYRFPWLKYQVDAPGYGSDYFIQVMWQPDKQSEIYTRFRSETKSVNELNNAATNFVTSLPRKSWRVHFSYAVSPNVRFRSRAEVLWYDNSGTKEEHGFLLYTEAHVKASTKFDGNGRLQYFETDGYNSRIYAYENDVLFNYSVPAFFDKGWRYYINAHYQYNKKFSAWLRWAQTLYSSREIIGSGMDALLSKHRSEIKLQLMCLL